MRVGGAGLSASVWSEESETEKFHFVTMRVTLLLFLGWGRRCHPTCAVFQRFSLSCSERLWISCIPICWQELLFENPKRNSFSAELLSKPCYLVNRGVNYT